MCWTVEAFADDPPVNDPWMQEMENSVGLTVGGDPRVPGADIVPEDDEDADEGTGDSQPRSGDTSGTGTVISTTDEVPIDPNSLDPNDPAIANLIRQWIAVAEPPQNAVPGSNWRYDKLGRIVGSGPGLTTVQEGIHDSVIYGRATPEETVWSLRQKLDSINHCTLEEYVVARMSQETVQHCMGRYGAVRELKGVKLAEAKEAVTGKGFKYSLAPGSPAKSENESGTVEKQKPGPQQYLKKGAEVTLYVHSPYVPQVPELPDFTNKPLAEAKDWLQENELQAKLKPGKSAPAANLSGAVQKQAPEPGTTIGAGTTVTLTVYSNYVDTRRVPDVIGLKAAAAGERLSTAGLSLEEEHEAGRPPDGSLAHTAKEQEPAPDTEVMPGQKVRVWFYGRYEKTRDELVAEYDCTGILGSRAYWDNNANAPRCGCFDGLRFNLSRNRCVQQSVANNEVCTRDFPGSISTGQAPDGSVNCDCPRGLKWNSTNTRCIDEAIVNNEICARNYQGSIARGYLDNGKINCTCPAGTKWNSDRTRCINEAIANNELCARDFPGSIARGYQNDGRINCECPSGLVWNRNGSACVRPTRQQDNTQACEQAIWQIEMMMVTYNLDRQGNAHMGQMAQNRARDARNLGCDQNRINQALATGGGGGNGCPPGSELVSVPSPSGPIYTCSPAGTNNRQQQQPPGSCNDPGMRIVYKLIDPPPWSGVTFLCRDSSGGLWHQTASRMTAVSNIQMGTKERNVNCYWGSKIHTRERVIEGRLCPQ